MIIKAAKFIPKHFGATPQWGYYNNKSKIDEEVKELKESIYAYEIYQGKEQSDDLVDELADVIFLLVQIIVTYRPSLFAIFKRLRFKAKRTIQRIASGYYEKGEWKS